MTIQEDFLKEFQDLLNKYDAEFCMEDSSSSRWSSEKHPVIYFNGKYDIDPIRPMEEMDLPFPMFPVKNVNSLTDDILIKEQNS